MECLAVGEVQLIAKRLVCAEHNPLLGGDLIGRFCLSVVQLDGWSDVNFSKREVSQFSGPETPF